MLICEKFKRTLLSIKRWCSSVPVYYIGLCDFKIGRTCTGTMQATILKFAFCEFDLNERSKYIWYCPKTKHAKPPMHLLRSPTHPLPASMPACEYVLCVFYAHTTLTCVSRVTSVLRQTCGFITYSQVSVLLQKGATPENNKFIKR